MIIIGEILKHSLRAIILIPIFVFICNSSFAQDKSVQKFFYQDDVVNVMVQIHGKENCLNDSIKISYRIRNISCETIYALYEQHAINGTGENGRYIIIDLGMEYSPGMEFEDKIVEIFPGSAYEYSEFLKLEDKGINDSVKVICGVAYVSDNKLKKNLLSADYTMTQDDNVYTLFSGEIFLSLIYGDYFSCGNVKLLKCN